MVRKSLKDKIVGHISRDSTAIEGREKPVKKPAMEEPQAAKRRGRPKKGEERTESQIKRMDLQVGRSLNENIMELPNYCNVGRNSKGHQES
jgi:hypothetical protein